MRKKLVRLGTYVALMGMLLSASASVVDADAMQLMEDRQKSLSSNIAIKDVKSALTDAKELEAMFKEVATFYEQKGNAADAVTWSKENREIAGVVVAQALAAKDFDTASRQSVTMAKNCKACHQLYKSQD